MTAAGARPTIFKRTSWYEQGTLSPLAGADAVVDRVHHTCLVRRRSPGCNRTRAPGGPNSSWCVFSPRHNAWLDVCGFPARSKAREAFLNTRATCSRLPPACLVRARASPEPIQWANHRSLLSSNAASGAYASNGETAKLGSSGDLGSEDEAQRWANEHRWMARQTAKDEWQAGAQ